jgi:plasmid maintenance system killer protein
MEIKFTTVELLNFYTGNYSGKQKLPHDILIRFKDKIDFMKAATSINELSRIRSLNIEKIGAHWSARINSKYRIEFDFIKPNTLMILKISNHHE